MRSSVVATGIANTLGNKGGVGIRMKVGDTRLLFVSAHLAAHQNAVEERNEQFKKIELQLSRNFSMLPDNTIAESSKDIISTGVLNYTSVSERVFFMGDLNYRVRGNR